MLPTTPPSTDVRGHCPACGGSSLFLGTGGYVTCGYVSCPNPTAAGDVLAERETEHIVTFRAGDFTIRHPLRERLDGELEDCALHKRVFQMGGPPVQPGRYRARQTAMGWDWEVLP